MKIMRTHDRCINLEISPLKHIPLFGSQRRLHPGFPTRARHRGTVGQQVGRQLATNVGLTVILLEKSLRLLQKQISYLLLSNKFQTNYKKLSESICFKCSWNNLSLIHVYCLVPLYGSITNICSCQTLCFVCVLPTNPAKASQPRLKHPCGFQERKTLAPLRRLFVGAATTVQ